MEQDRDSCRPAASRHPAGSYHTPTTVPAWRRANTSASRRANTSAASNPAGGTASTSASCCKRPVEPKQRCRDECKSLRNGPQNVLLRRVGLLV